MIRRVLGVLALATTLLALPFAALAAMMPWEMADPVLWRWMPHGEDMYEQQRRGRASYSRLGFAEMFALPAKVTLLYDPQHHVVLYSEACCASQRTVLGEVSGRPPRTLRTASLGAVRTVRGIGLGASPDAVRRKYGPARLHRSTVSPGLRVLAYYRARPLPGTFCGWYENFVFRASRLTEILAGYSC